MWIKLDLYGIVFQLQISNYHLSKKKTSYEKWCKVSCSIVDEKNKIINYSVYDNELLLCSEVEEITVSIEKLLENKCTSKTEIEFIEPDFKLVLSRKLETGRISMEWKVHLWSDGLTPNYFSTEFSAEKLKYLLAYLKYIIGEYKKDTQIIKEMMNSGILYG